MKLTEMNKEQLEARVVADSELIKELEKSWPKFVDVNNDRYDQYRPENKGWSIHDTKVRDAYWRRRMSKSALHTLYKTEKEREAHLNATATIG